MKVGTPVRVLHVVNSLEPGGMENGVVNMARALRSREFEMHIACLERRGAFADRLPKPDSAIVMGKRNGFSPAAAVRLGQCISSVRPHVVHSHNLGPLIYASLATAGGLRCPIIHGEHSHLTPDELSPRRLRQRRLLYRCCRKVHTVSHQMRDELLGLKLSPGKVVAITNGVDTERFTLGDRTLARTRLNLPIGSVLIGIVGRFGPFKGHNVLLEAFEKIANAAPHVGLVIAGTGGPQEAAVASRARMSPVADRIHVLGFQADPIPCYQALDVLAIPSTNEGLSNVAIEAMSCGIPILGNTGAGHEQIVDSGTDGIIADIRTPECLAAELAQLLAQPEKLTTMGRAARQKIETRFSISAMADAYEKLYRSVAVAP